MSTAAQYRHIAAELRQIAKRLPPSTDEMVDIALVRPGINLNIRCVNAPDAIMAVAAKYERGPNFHKPQTYGPRLNRKPPAPVLAAVMTFMDDGEWDNAREYLRQWPREKWPQAAVARLVEWETGAPRSGQGLRIRT